MIQPAPVCFFNCGVLTPEQARYKFALWIDGFPPEEFSYIWFEDIVKYKYFITSYGRVFTTYGKELKIMYDYAHNDKENNKAYMRIELVTNDPPYKKKFYVHRLVANAFIPKTPADIFFNRNFVNHKFNVDPRCNYAWNLEWCTSEENSIHYHSFNQGYDPSLFDFSYIDNRIAVLDEYNSYTDNLLSDHQAMLVCYGYTVKGYNPIDCAIYACLEPTPNIMKSVHSILSGRSYNRISSKYEIIPYKK